MAKACGTKREKRGRQRAEEVKGWRKRRKESYNKGSEEEMKGSSERPRRRGAK